MKNFFRIKSHNNDLFVIGNIDFNPKKIFENGQAFRWDENDGKYTIVANEYVSRIYILNPSEKKFFVDSKILSKEDEIFQIVRLENAGSLYDYESFWENYFDMSRDYDLLTQELSNIDSNLLEATKFGKGFRVLKQDLFEMIISFIISANNNIKRIKSSVEKICTICKNEIGEFDGKIYYRFPTPSQIAELSIKELESTGIGYRTEYVKNTASKIANGEWDIKKISTLSYDDAHKYLLELMGVGPKVADCILLFGDSRDIAFPVDTWVAKIMNYFYLENESNPKKIKESGFKLFGDKAGLAQQYLFYYARENNIGRK